MPAKSLSFFDHLDELRSRVIKSAVFFLVGSFLVYRFTDFFLSWLIRPIGRVVFTSPTDAFMAKLTLTFLGGFLVSFPFILYQIWRFVYTGLTPRERKIVVVYGPASLVLFFAGGLFAYGVMIPFSLKFLLSFATESMIPLITVDKYISYVGSLILAFGITFELPLVIVFLAQIGVATPEFLRQYRRHAAVIILVFSAVLTPPDIISLLIMSGPLILLYEAGIFLSYFVARRRSAVR